MINIHHLMKKGIGGLLIAAITLSSCKEFVKLDAPRNQVGLDQSFQSDATAASAVLGIYNAGLTRDMLFAMTAFPGLSADEVQYNTSVPVYDEFETNSLSINNAKIAQEMWYYNYYVLSQANMSLTG